MRYLLVYASAFSVVAAAAYAQPMNGPNTVVTGPPGFRSTEPLVHHPTNLNEATTRSEISPALPQPNVGPNAGIADMLQHAQNAIQSNRLGLAQAALEQAETASLNRSSRWRLVPIEYWATAQSSLSKGDFKMISL